MKKFIAALAAAAVLTASSSMVSAASFKDIPSGHWAYPDVTQMADAGIVEGYSDGTFRGDRSITGAEMAKMTGNLFLKLSPNSSAEVKKFIEDSSSDKAATRYEIALMLATVYSKVHQGNPPAATEGFKDVPADHWAADSVNLMKATKIIQGYGDGTFRGDKNMTRYEAVLTLAKLYKTLSN